MGLNMDMPSDLETRILFKKNISIGSYECSFEYWAWDGITGNSVIFKIDSGLINEDDYFIGLVKTHFDCSPQVQFTVTRNNPDYVFVNFFEPEQEEDYQSWKP